MDKEKSKKKEMTPWNIKSFAPVYRDDGHDVRYLFRLLDED